MSAQEPPASRSHDATAFVEVTRLAKRFGAVSAVDGVSFDVKAGELLPYGVDILHGAMHQGNTMPLALDFAAIGMFCVALFLLSVRNIHRKWIV
jgi:hypothetical protein